MTGRRPFDRARFGEILDAYGADPDRWPADEREAALGLMREDPAARALSERAERLDRALASLDDAEPSRDLVARVLAAVPSTARAMAPRRSPSFARGGGRRAMRYAAAALPMAAAAALALWIIRAPEREVPMAEALAALGTYETPGDELLTTSEVDLFSDPWVDCPESVLGCIDVDIDASEPRSDAASETRTRA
jgi:hypothetical protein